MKRSLTVVTLMTDQEDSIARKTVQTLYTELQKTVIRLRTGLRNFQVYFVDL